MNRNILIIDGHPDPCVDRLALSVRANIRHGELAGISPSVGRRSCQMRRERDVRQPAKAGIDRQRLHRKNIEADVEHPLARHAQQRRLIHDGAASYVDEHSTGLDGA